ncbi:unnamed protein product [Oikopleura dioica]|uniref:Eukaryotic peptide chain release factor subunit 1 n=1 Tax=Oikopleura dioica TaxID=34765 RepID=E4Y6B6_OIKDI|nr:unnamed protein product [Oikopleura dioica]
MDGNGCLFATLTGNTRDIIQKFDVDLPKKHGRGGQSALRFARLRMEKRHNFVRKVAETAVKCFIKDDKVSCVGLILAGSADFKTELNGSDMFDQRLAAKVIRTVDVSYGGENGFNQAIELVQDDLSNVKFVQEKKLICQYFDEISRDTGKYCFAIGDTVNALEQGAVETLIIWENLDIKRYVFRNPVSELNEVKYLNQTEEKDRKHFVDKSTGQELESISVETFIDWLVDTRLLLIDLRKVLSLSKDSVALEDYCDILLILRRKNIYPTKTTSIWMTIDESRGWLLVNCAHAI